MPEAAQQQQELRDLGWVILELMGHRKTGAKVREEILFGVVMCRAEIPVQVADGEPEKWLTQFYSGSSIYCISPTTEPLARAVAARFTQPPVNRYELPAMVASTVRHEEEEDFDPDPEEHDGAPDFTANRDDVEDF